jgi:G:T-mismatch repair DNA endonuclease (very short patch repair protein)
MKEFSTAYIIKEGLTSSFWNAAALRDDGWKVIVVWECELKPMARSERLERLYEDIIKW